MTFDDDFTETKQHSDSKMFKNHENLRHHRKKNLKNCEPQVISAKKQR